MNRALKFTAYYGSLALVGLACWAGTQAVLRPGLAQVAAPDDDTPIPADAIVSTAAVTFDGLADGVPVTAASPVPVRATLAFHDNGRDRQFWWFCTVMNANPNPDGTFTVVWQHEYGDQMLNVPQGVVPNATFAEDLALVPGRYSVQVGVREARTVQDGEGNVVANDQEIAVNYFELTVTQ